MKKPKDGETLTQAQIGEAVNVKDFESVEIKKNWHIGQFECNYPGVRPALA